MILPPRVRYSVRIEKKHEATLQRMIHAMQPLQLASVEGSAELLR
jgi:hypothetical protein